MFTWQGGYAGPVAEAPPVSQQGGGTYYRFPAPVLPPVDKPHLYIHRGEIHLGRFRFGSRVVFFENRAQAEDEEIILLLELL